jgi:small subunit ribosomal protein S3
MGQKVNPNGLRLCVKHNWKSAWVAKGSEAGSFLKEDRLIRAYLAKKYENAALSSISIQRTGQKIQITLHTARPGVIIGKKGADIEALKGDLGKRFKKEFWVEVEEVKKPDADPCLIAQGLARQVERRLAAKKIIKRALEAAKDAGAIGGAISISGPIGGADIARTEKSAFGLIQKNTLSSDVVAHQQDAHTSYGIISCRVLITRSVKH